MLAEVYSSSPELLQAIALHIYTSNLLGRKQTPLGFVCSGLAVLDGQPSGKALDRLIALG